MIFFFSRSYFLFVRGCLFCWFTCGGNSLFKRFFRRNKTNSKRMMTTKTWKMKTRNYHNLVINNNINAPNTIRVTLRKKESIEIGQDKGREVLKIQVVKIQVVNRAYLSRVWSWFKTDGKNFMNSRVMSLKGIIWAMYIGKKCFFLQECSFANSKK